MKDLDLTQLILRILMANENPLTIEEIYDVIRDEQLVDISLPEHSEKQLKKEIGQFLLKAAVLHHRTMALLPTGEFAYTPSDGRTLVTAESIVDVYFKGNWDSPEVKVDTLNGLPILEIIAADGDKAELQKLLQVRDGRLRYVGFNELLCLEHNPTDIDDILVTGLSDPNVKVNLAAIHNTWRSASTEVYTKLANLMDSDDLFNAAQQACKYINDAVVYDKFADLTQSTNIDKARFPCFHLQKSGYGVGVRGQFKVLENWDSCKDNFSELGYSEDEVVENIISNIRYHRRFPRFVKEYLMDMCNSSNGVVQNQALKCLDERWAKKDLKILEALNTEGNPRAQSLQLKNIAMLNGQKSISLAINLLNDPIVCNTAVEVLGNHGSESELETLMNIANDVVKWNQYDLKILAQAINKLKKKLK
jgi:hypothetical protein